jgi:hypothetical protein
MSWFVSELPEEDISQMRRSFVVVMIEKQSGQRVNIKHCFARCQGSSACLGINPPQFLHYGKYLIPDMNSEQTGFQAPIIRLSTTHLSKKEFG